MIAKRRIIAYVLALSAVFSGSASAFLEDIDDVPEKNITADESTAGMFSEDDIEKSYELLHYIGSVGDERESFEENETVTKAYAAACMAVITSGSAADAKFESVFSDVTEKHEYAAQIAYALSVGIIDKADKFYPNKDVSAEELSDMAIRALKYDYIYLNSSSYERALDIGLFKGVKYSSASITKGQFMLFLKNVLDTDYIKISGLDGYGTANIEAVDGVSHLEKYFDIYKQDGIVTGYKYSQINSEADLNEGIIQINRSNFNTDSVLDMDIVGAYVDAYVDKNEDNYVICVYVNKKKNAAWEFARGDFDGTGRTEISYLTENKRTRVKLSDSAVIMYNNSYLGLFSQVGTDTLLDTADRVYLMDNDGDGICDIIKVEKCSYYIIKSVSPTSESLVFDKNGGTFDIDANWNVEFIYENESIDLSGLKANDVLTVLEVTRKDSTKIFSAIVTRDIEEGTISQVGNDDLGDYYEIGNEYYYFTDEYKTYISSAASEKKPRVGDFVRIYLSADKKIVAQSSEDDFFYGYIMSGVKDAELEEVKLKIYTTSGDAVTYYFADKVKVYNETYQTGIKKDKMDAANIYLGISGDESAKVRNDVVAYCLNSEGKISAIASAVDRTKYTHGSLYYPLTLDYDGTSVTSQSFMSRIYREVFASQYKISSSCPILTIPQDDGLKTDERAYGIKKSTSWGAEGKYVNGKSFKLYSCDKFYVPEFCTMIDTMETSIGQGSYGEVYFNIIDKVTQTIDEDDMEKTQIRYLSNGKFSTSVISEDVSFVDAGLWCETDSIEKLQKGDVIQLETNSLGEVYLIKVLFSIKNRPTEYGAYFSTNTTTDSSGVKRIVPKENALDTSAHDIALFYGRVEDINGDVLLINTSKAGTDSSYNFTMIIGNSVYKACGYSLYDTRTGQVSSASASEIQPNDVVLLRRYYNSVQDVIIIR